MAIKQVTIMEINSVATDAQDLLTMETRAALLIVGLKQWMGVCP